MRGKEDQEIEVAHFNQHGTENNELSILSIVVLNKMERFFVWEWHDHKTWNCLPLRIELFVWLNQCNKHMYDNPYIDINYAKNAIKVIN